MEPAKIDWKRISSISMVDDLYEHINAPKFVDFLVPDEPVDDEAWFCRPDCNHPKTVEDLLKATPLLKRSATISEVLPQRDRDRNTRDSYWKRMGLTQPSDLANKNLNYNRFVEDGENQNPNLCSTPSHHYNIMKTTIKSSTERKQIATQTKQEETPRLRSTLSARNLFGGRDLMSHFMEFCNEVKKLTTRATEKENVEKSDGKKLERKERDSSNLREMDKREERKPLLEVSKEKYEAVQKNTLKEKQTMKKSVDVVENKPSPLELKYIKCKEGENLLQIRTNPPSPQCFSASRGPDKAAPLKSSRSKPPQERGILQELELGNTELKRKNADTKRSGGKSASPDAEREARTLDVFWFLKPCTLSS